MKKYFVFTLLLIFFVLLFCNYNVVFATSFEEQVEQQLLKIDFEQIEQFVSKLNLTDQSFVGIIKKLLAGEFQLNYTDLFSYILSLFFSYFYNSLPLFLGVISIALFSSLINYLKSNKLSDSVNDTISFVSILCIITLLSSTLISSFKLVYDTISSICTLTQVVSPIILTLMVAGGANASFGAYKPTVVFYANTILGLILSIILPLILILGFFSLISHISKTFDFNGIVNFISSTIKWILGIITCIFTLFISVQGISVAIHDGIRLRATKYAISSMVPIIGGLVGEGYNIVSLASLLLKNSIGVGSVVILFLIILVPAFKIIVLSWLTKLTSAISDCFLDKKVGGLCLSLAKVFNFLLTVMLVVGIITFFMFLLMIVSANSFI